VQAITSSLLARRHRAQTDSSATTNSGDAVERAAAVLVDRMEAAARGSDHGLESHKTAGMRRFAHTDAISSAGPWRCEWAIAQGAGHGRLSYLDRVRCECARCQHNRIPALRHSEQQRLPGRPFELRPGTVRLPVDRHAVVAMHDDLCADSSSATISKCR
jgi:hypothetical protein